MLYVQQSLGPNEEILLGARFHWMYTVKALMWVLMGLTLGISLAYAAIWWELNETVRAVYGDIPEHLYPEAEQAILKQKGGYLAILWSLSPLLRMSILGLFVFGLFLYMYPAIPDINPPPPTGTKTASGPSLPICLRIPYPIVPCPAIISMSL